MPEGGESRPEDYYEAGHAVTRAVRSLFDGQGLAMRADLQGELLGLVAQFATRTMRTYEALLLLCESGYGVESQSFVRILLEDLINLRYIATDPKNLSAAWAEHESRRRYQYFLRQRETDPKTRAPADLPELEARYRADERMVRSWPQGRKMHPPQVIREIAKMQWTPKSVLFRAREADASGRYQGTERGYEQLYPYLCEHTHGSSAVARDYLAEIDGHVHVVADQESYKSVSPLVLGTWYLHWLQQVLGDLGLTDPVDVMAIASNFADFEHGATDLDR